MRITHGTEEILELRYRKTFTQNPSLFLRVSIEAKYLDHKTSQFRPDGQVLRQPAQDGIE
jgi:hypothetical protein